jgi:hypothetical protein
MHKRKESIMNKVLATIGAAKALEDVETYGDWHRSYPSVNVKKWVSVDDIPWSDLALEHGDDAEIVHTWARALIDTQEYDQMNAAEEIARECWWDDATELAHETFGGHVKVYGEGRQGGHLVVHGIGHPDDWTVEVCERCGPECECSADDYGDAFEIPDVGKVMAWCEFEQNIASMVDDFPYSVGWHLIVNVHGSIMEGMRHAL